MWVPEVTVFTQDVENKANFTGTDVSSPDDL